MNEPGLQRWDIIEGNERSLIIITTKKERKKTSASNAIIFRGPWKLWVTFENISPYYDEGNARCWGCAPLCASERQKSEM